MSDSYANYPEPYAYPALVEGDVMSSPNRDWLFGGIWVTVLTLLGVVFANKTAVALFGYTFSFRTACLYVSLGSLAVLFLSIVRYPLAAAIFYGFLPLVQATGAEKYPLGDANAALTFEMILAVPLVLGGLLGPGGATPGYSRSLPPLLTWTSVFILVCAVISTVFATDPSVAVYTLIARFIFPIAVTFVTYRRLRDIDDYKTVWFGFLAGVLLITVFDFRRVVWGQEMSFLSRTINQRQLGATKSFAIPAFYTFGPALWLGVALATRGKILRGILWLMLPAVFAIMFWLGGHRGPVLFMGILVAWWLPRNVLVRLYKPGVLVLAVFGGILIVLMTLFVLGRSTMSASAILERFFIMKQAGVTQESRWILWMRGVEYLKSSPVWGIGLNNWIVVDPYGFESIHSTFFGILVDLGVLGFCVYTVFVAKILLMVRKSTLAAFSFWDQAFILGCRAGWCVMLMLLAIDLSMTSGQLRNTIFCYAFFFYPMLVMIIHSRHPEAEFGGWGYSPEPVLPENCRWEGGMSHTYPAGVPK